MARADAHSGAAMLHAYGGVKNTYVAPTDEELGIAAWAVAEQWEQRAQLFTVLKRTFVRHGWIENGAALDAQAAAAFARLPAPTTDAATLTLHDISVGKQVSSLMEPEKQYEWALQLIRGGTFASIDTFYEHCYGLVEQSFLSAAEKVLLRTWSLLRRLPRELVDAVTARELSGDRPTARRNRVARPWHLRREHAAVGTRSLQAGRKPLLQREELTEADRRDAPRRVRGARH